MARVLGFVGIVLLAGCVSTQYTMVTPGQVMVSNLSVSASDSGWNKAPGVLTGFLHEGGELWTRDGLLLDRLMIVTSVGNGGTLFKTNDESVVYPAYKTGMLPNEIMEMTQSSLAKYYGTEAVVETSGLRPHRLGEQRAAMFDFKITASEAPTQQGRALAFINDDELYAMIYIATQIHYFEKHWDEALAVMQSARVVAQPG